jgi:hypothetical protein
LAVLAVGSVAGPPARADFTYATHSSPQVFAADGGTKSVIFLLESAGGAKGSSDVNLTSSIGLSAVDQNHPSSFTSRPFTVSMMLTDTASTASTLLTFTGTLAGTMTHAAAQIMVQFTGQTSQTAKLGGNTYTISVQPGPSPMSLAPVGVFPGLYIGNLTAHIDVNSAGTTGGGGGSGGGGGGGGGPPSGGGGGGTSGGGGGGTPGGVSNSPEPSTLVASCVGLTFLGLAGWRKRRARILAA